MHTHKRQTHIYAVMCLADCSAQCHTNHRGSNFDETAPTRLHVIVTQQPSNRALGFLPKSWIENDVLCSVYRLILTNRKKHYPNTARHHASAHEGDMLHVNGRQVRYTDHREQGELRRALY